MDGSPSTTDNSPRIRTRRSETASSALFPGVVKTGRLLRSIADPEDRSLPGHLDLVETAVYTTSEPNRVLVEFTTRSPIRPLPGQELVYELQLDVDEPFTDERDDRDLLMGAVVLPDGRLEARWDATSAPFQRHENPDRVVGSFANDRGPLGVRFRPQLDRELHYRGLEFW